ncbi:MAG: hypothetical protein EA389_01200 [Ilumatobacter sp.]|nr:MAG: hypothetical protein EA389_01200 [Ilumatobacter sp.]
MNTGRVESVHMVSLRRLLLLALMSGAVYAGYVLWRRDRVGDGAVAPPEWPPFPAPAAVPNIVADTGRTWIEPVDGTCPIDHPVKLNENSGIFHVPGGRFYERTRADRCYASAEAAEADGYRQAKT